MNKEIEELADRIFEAFSHQNPTNIKVFQHEVEEADTTRVLIFLLQNYIIPFEYLLMAYRESLEKLSLGDWNNMLKQLVIDIKNYPTAFTGFIILTYKFMEIDFIKEFIKIDNVDNKIKNNFLKYFAQHPGLFATDENVVTRFKKFDIVQDKFDTIKNKLISEGASEAEEIKMKVSEIVKSVEVSHIQMSPPKSWTWVKEYL